MPLTLPNSGLMLSPWSEKKTNGCWELLLLGVSHLERALPTFIRPSACPHVLSGLFLVFLSVPSPLISVSLYPFNDFFFFFFQYPLFMRQESHCEQSAVVLWTGQCFFQKLPKIAVYVSLSSFPECEHTPLSFLCGKGSVASPLTCTLGSWILLLLCWLRAEQDFIGGKNAARALLEFLILRNL